MSSQCGNDKPSREPRNARGKSAGQIRTAGLRICGGSDAFKAEAEQPASSLVGGRSTCAHWPSACTPASVRPAPCTRISCAEQPLRMPLRSDPGSVSPRAWLCQPQKLRAVDKRRSIFRRRARPERGSGVVSLGKGARLEAALVGHQAVEITLQEHLCRHLVDVAAAFADRFSRFPQVRAAPPRSKAARPRSGLRSSPSP